MSSLSVIIANYNHAHYLRGALDAILSQSYQPTEIIIIDDGSTDDSREVICEFARAHSTIRFLQNDRNMGAVFTANRALALASGDYVYAAAVDDRVGPAFFERSMGLLEQHPEAGLCCSDPASFDRTGIISTNPNRWSEHPRYLPPDDLAAVLRGGFIAGHTAIAKRVHMTALGGFRTELKWACDWFLWLAIGFRFGICYVPAPLAAFRRRLDSFSAVGERDRQQHAAVLTNLLHLVRSPECRDVLPYFVRSGAFQHFGPQLVDLVLADPAHWTLETLLLLLYPLYEWSTRMASDRDRRQENLRARLEQLVPSIVARCARDNVRSIALFGAGSHSRALLPLWLQAGGPPPTAVLVSDAGPSTQFMGLSVVRAADYHPSADEAILLSSSSYEGEMAAVCERLWPRNKCYRLYHPEDDGAPASEPSWEAIARP